MWNIILPILLFLTSAFLILLVLIQRGRGGGLAGAFGGMGGQSAFGTKAGDLFTRITIVVAAFWIVLCAFSVRILNDTGSNMLSPTLGTQGAKELPGAPATGTAPAKSGKEGAAPSTDAKATESAPANGAAAPAATEAPAAAPAAAETPPAESTPAAPEKSE
jgi:preprotein translocase subunit SecG